MERRTAIVCTIKKCVLVLEALRVLVLGGGKRRKIIRICNIFITGTNLNVLIV